MARMTEEEAWAADRYYTEHTPRLSGDGKSGFIARHLAKGDTLVFADSPAGEEPRFNASGQPEAGGGKLAHEKVFAAARA